jgi:outer membrane receptor protein involved in Fe transport
VKKINIGLKSSLLLGAATVAVFGLTAIAQAAEDVETVVVTGSRIAQPTLDSAGPLTVLSSQDIAKTNTTSIDQLLQKLPAVSSSQQGEGTNNGGFGDSYVDLRGFGAGRTLVLIDGKRTVAGGSQGPSGAVDLSAIPMGMVDHVEVYQDGASAVYGSDAIAGVVNVILKKDFSGVQASASYGQTDKNDGDTSNINAVIGLSGDKGHVIIGIDYALRNGILQGDRKFSAHYKYESSPGVLTNGGSSSQVGGLAWTYSYTDSSQNKKAVSSCGGAVKMTWANGTCAADGGSANRYNYAARSMLTVPMNRTSLSLSGDYEITPAVTAFMSGFYTNRHSKEQLAPDPSTPLYVPASNPYNTTGYSLYMKRRPTENGDRHYSQNVQTFRINVGLKGTLESLIPDGKWEVDMIYGRTDSVSTTSKLNLMSHYAIALDPDKCAADSLCSAAADAAGQTAVNVFGVGTVKSAWLDYLTAETHDTGGNDLRMYSGDISGTLMELPAGKLGFALGAEYREESGYFHPDYLNATGQTDQGAVATDGGFKTYEVYGELKVPILKDLPYVKSLDLSLAGRIGEFSAASSKEAITYKIGLNYQPIDDVKFRGIFSRATRFPSISDLYGGAYTSYDFASDPCDASVGKRGNAAVNANCAAQGLSSGWTSSSSGQILTEYTSNPDLSPERATTFTFGVVFTPEVLPGLTATIDYWHIRINGYISTLDTQTELDACYESADMSSAFCSRFHRNASGEITDNQSPMTNLDYMQADGIDFSATYQTELFGGALSVTPALTWLDSWTQQPNATAGATQYAGTVGTLGVMGHFRGNLGINYDLENLGFAFTERFIGGAKDVWADSTYKYNKVPDVYYTDIEAHYNFGSYSFQIGMDNVFDKTPPYYDDAIDCNTDPGTYDLKGRYMWVRIGVKI